MKKVAPLPKLALEAVEFDSTFKRQSLRARALLAVCVSIISVVIGMGIFHIIAVKVYKPVVEKVSEPNTLHAAETVIEEELSPKVTLPHLSTQAPPKYGLEDQPVFVGKADVKLPEIEGLLVTSFEDMIFEEEIFEEIAREPLKKAKKTVPRKAKTTSSKKKPSSTAALARKITQKAKLVSRGKVNYPRKARQKGFEGSVLVTVTVDHLGQVQTAKVKRSSKHSMLDAAALKAAKRYRFAPALNGLGKTVISKIDIPFTFKLS